MNTTDKKTPPHQPSRELPDVADPIRAFTKAERKRLWHNSPEHQKDAISRAAFERIVTLTERAHGMLQTVQPSEVLDEPMGGLLADQPLDQAEPTGTPAANVNADKLGQVAQELHQDIGPLCDRVEVTIGHREGVWFTLCAMNHEEAARQGITKVSPKYDCFGDVKS